MRDRRRLSGIRGGTLRTEQVPEPREEWTVHRSAQGFAIDHPSTWRVLPAMAGMLVSLIAPGPKDVFSANANVVRRARDVPLDLDRLMETSIQVLLRVLSEALIVDVDTDVISKQPARRLLVAYRQGIYALTCQQWLLMTDDHIWTVSTGARSDEWAQRAAVFDRIGHSFTLEAT